MGSFKCQHRSISLSFVLLCVVLLLNAHVGLCRCYKRIFSLGDSIIDTGNFAHMTGNKPSPCKEPPYGMTYFNRPTGRICDGRVLLDFYGECVCISSCQLSISHVINLLMS